MNRTPKDMLEWTGTFTLIDSEGNPIERLIEVDLFYDDYPENEIEEDLYSLALMTAEGKGYDMLDHEMITESIVRA